MTRSVPCKRAFLGRTRPSVSSAFGITAAWARRRAGTPLRPRPDPWIFSALIALFGLIIIATLGAQIAPHEPIYFVVEHGTDPRPYDPGLVFPFGSDVLGRDLLSLVLTGARATLAIVLAAGTARVLAGVLMASLGALWGPARVLTEALSDFVGAIPATLVALVLIRAFVKTDTSVTVLIGSLLLVGWAGPYRLIRVELDRLRRAPFTEGAHAIGVSTRRLIWRHQLPHLVPAIAVNLSQQIVASLVLVAELGVLGVIVSPVRSINIEESLSVVRVGPPVAAAIPDVPEWGAMLASSRTIEILWLTRWVIFVPGLAFAITAAAVALIGFAIARRYRRRDVVADARGIALVLLAIVLTVAASALVPPRYVEAREWAQAARAELPASHATTAAAFNDAGLHAYAAGRETTAIARASAATITIGSVSLAESFPLASNPPSNTVHVRSLVSAELGGGGSVEAPLVFAARGIVPAEHQPLSAFERSRTRTRADLGKLIEAYPDDYAGLDVRGKIVLLARFAGIDAGTLGFANGWSVGTSITGAVERGAAAVVFVDPFVGDVRSGNPRSPDAENPYTLIERTSPPLRVAGVPVIVIDRQAAQALLTPIGVDIEPLLGYDFAENVPVHSVSRDLNAVAQISVPVREVRTTITSLVREVPGIAAQTPRVVVWAARTIEGEPLDNARADAMAALANLAVARHAPFIFVDFDPRADSQAVAEALRAHPILVVLVLDRLDRSTLTFTTANGDLIPAFDLYAEEAGARHQVTRHTATAEAMPAALPGEKTVLIGSVGDAGDARPDLVAVVGYLAGRLAQGAPELAR